GGTDFAPRTTVEGEPVQEYLQRHYFQAFQQLALRLKNQPNVLGYDTMNEPSCGYIGWQDLNTPGGLLAIGDVPTPFQSMLLGEGIPQDVEEWVLGVASFKRLGTHRMNDSRTRAWRDGFECIWRQNGVWDFDNSGAAQLLRSDYFARVNGKPVDFSRDYYRPFANRFAAAIQAVHPNALIFLETAQDNPISKWGNEDASGIVYAPHWYDAYVLVKKTFIPILGIDNFARKLVVGHPAIRRSYHRQLAMLKGYAENQLGSVPFVLGEFGIPFDLDGKKAYKNGDFSTQVSALQRSMQAVEDNLLNYTLWNYTPDNSNLHGDLWNDEDLSIYSPDQRANLRDINSGGRALQAVVRPYPVATAGKLLKANFNPRTRVFKMELLHDPLIAAPTEIYVPNYQYPHGYSIRVSDGRYEIHHSKQRLLYWPDPAKIVHKLTVKP
ncbi:MAG: hypothetical protein A2Y88_08095, partial [Chloroflexi bacterium RBG_13_48_10]